jgi:hypothetical protein
MAVAYTFNQSASGSSAIDLTDPDTNPGAAPMSTPRQGGFTLRNRIDASQLSTADTKLFTIGAVATAAVVANQLLVLEVPKRTFVKSVTQKVPVGATAPTTAYTSVSAAGNSVFSNAELMLGALAYTSASQASMKADLTDGHADLSSLDGAVFGHMPITKETGLTGGLPSAVSSSSSSTPWAGGLLWNFTGAAETITSEGRYFPYGGFVTLVVGPDAFATSSVSSAHVTASTTAGNIAGVWDFMADCEYLPE